MSDQSIDLYGFWILAILLSLPFLLVGIAVALIERIAYGDSIIGQILAKPFMYCYEQLSKYKDSER